MSCRERYSERRRQRGISPSRFGDSGGSDADVEEFLREINTD